MGWNSWYCFRRNVTQKDVRDAADAIVSSGMREVGYNFVNIDGSWQGKRDSKGTLQPNERFPDIKGQRLCASKGHARWLADSIPNRTV